MRQLIEAGLRTAKAWLSGLAALVLAVPAEAEYVSGAEFFDRCLSPRSSAEATCLGYVAGVADSVIAYEAEWSPDPSRLDEGDDGADRDDDEAEELDL